MSQKIQKKNPVFLIVFLFLYGIFFNFGFIEITTAFEEYETLENFPGYSEISDGIDLENDLPSLLQAFYRLAIWTSGIAAAFMITVGGFMYILSAGSGNMAGTGTAKNVMKDALIGLILVLSTWLILNTINPDLVDIDKNLNSLIPVVLDLSQGTETTQPSIKTGPVETTDPGPVTLQPDAIPGTYATHAEAAAAAATAGFTTSSSGGCNDRKNKDCTSLEGIPKETIEKLKRLYDGCDAPKVITGGTEIGHKSHHPGASIVDLKDTSDTCLLGRLKQPQNYGIKKICTNWGTKQKDANGVLKWTGGKYDYRYDKNNPPENVCTYPEKIPHFHVVFE